MLYLPTLISVIEVLIITLPVLFVVAFVTVAERKTMASMQRRLGPNIVGYYGLLQAFADALKLLLKEYVSPTQANLILFFLGPIITLIFSLLGVYLFVFKTGLLILPFLNFSCCLFYTIVMFTNYICRDKNTNYWKKLLFAFKIRHIIFNFIKKNVHLYLFIVWIIVFINLIMKYYYSSLFGFIWEDHYLLHMNRLLFISPIMIILYSYLFNAILFGKLTKVTDALKSVTFGRFIFIVFCYTILSYWGLGHIILVYLFSCIYDALFYFLDILFYIPKMHSLTNGLLKNIAECFTSSKRNYMTNYFYRYSLKSPSIVNIEYNYLYRIKTGNFIRNLLFNKGNSKIILKSSSICSMINSTMFSKINTILAKNLYVSSCISTEKLVNLITRNNLSLTNFVWENISTKMYVSKGQVYILLPWVNDSWVLISSNKYIVGNWNSLNFNPKLDTLSKSLYYNSKKLLQIPDNCSFNNVEFNISNLNKHGIEKIYTTNKSLELNSKNSSMLYKDSIDSYSNLDSLNIASNYYQNTMVFMMPSYSYDNTSINSFALSNLNSDFLMTMSEQSIGEVFASSYLGLDNKESNVLRSDMEEICVEANQIKEFMINNFLVFKCENRKGFTKLFIPDILDSAKKLRSEKLLERFNVSMGNFLKSYTLILINKENITQYSSLVVWPYTQIGVNFPLWNMHDIEVYTKTNALPDQWKSLNSDKKIESILALVPYLGEYYEDKQNQWNSPIEGSSRNYIPQTKPSWMLSPNQSDTLDLLAEKHLESNLIAGSLYMDSSVGGGESGSKKRGSRNSWDQKGKWKLPNITASGNTNFPVNFPVKGAGPVPSVMPSVALTVAPSVTATVASLVAPTAATTYNPPLAAVAVEGSSTQVDIENRVIYTTAILPADNPVTSTYIPNWNIDCERILQAAKTTLNSQLKGYINIAENAPYVIMPGFQEYPTLRKYLTDILYNTGDPIIRKQLGRHFNLQCVTKSPQVIKILRDHWEAQAAEINQASAGVPLNDPNYIAKSWFEICHYQLLKSEIKSGGFYEYIENAEAIRHLRMIWPRRLSAQRNASSIRSIIMDEIKTRNTIINWNDNLSKL